MYTDVLSLEIVGHAENPDLVDDLCCMAQNDSKRLAQAQNFYPKGSHTLSHLIRNGRFSGVGADYQILTDCKEVVICGAGLYVYPQRDHDGEQVSIIMSRMYTNPWYRGRWYGTHLLRSLARKCVTPTCMVTFNSENALLYESLTNRRLGLKWPEPWRAFKPIGEHVVNNVPQLCAVAYTQDLV
jgi:GNAT superfamily N-acetyltransferase